MSSVSAESLRAEIEKFGPPRRGKRYPLELRISIGEFAAARRALGDSVSGIARDLGLNVETLQRWMPLPADSRSFLPVRVATPPGSGLALVHPRTGLRVEGLSVTDLVDLLRRLE